MALLSRHVRDVIGEEAFALDGRLREWPLALIGEPDRHELAQIGQTIDTARLRVPDSGTAMAFNSFFWWRDRAEFLPLAGREGYSELRFDARCPTGVRGTPPHLDLLAASGQGLVAVAARGADYLVRRPGRLAAAYEGLEADADMAPWLRLLRLLRERPQYFRFVDAAALLKFALGLARTFPGHECRLLYLFWEPLDASCCDACIAHRRELDDLARMVEGASVSLDTQSFADLWAMWLGAVELPGLRELVARLEERYSVAIPAAG